MDIIAAVIFGAIGIAFMAKLYVEAEMELHTYYKTEPCTKCGK